MSRPESAESELAIARAARARFADAMDISIGAFAQALGAKLEAQIAQTTVARETQRARDDLVAFRSAESAWVAEARKQWKQVAEQNVDDSKGDVPISVRMTLVDDAVMEKNILMSHLAMAIQDKASHTFNDLRLRIQQLESSDEFSTRDVFRPESIAAVLIDKWMMVGLRRELWERMQSFLHNHFSKAALEAYKDVNEFLIEQGVMPEIDLKRLVKRQAAPAQGNSGPNTAFAPPGGPNANEGGANTGYQGAPGYPGQAGPYGPPGGYPGQWPGMHGSSYMVPGMMGDTLAFGPGPGGMPPEGYVGMPVQGDAAVMTPFAVAKQRAMGVLSNLRRMIGQRADTTAGSTLLGDDGAGAFIAAIVDAGLAFQLNNAGGPVASGDAVKVADMLERGATELQRRSNDLKKAAPTSADKATVEIVALMFQSILSEERIPFSIRVWFARLQMPVLRVAIAEPEFFSTLNHPARKLIDRMGSVVMGFDAAAISGSALENEVRRIVQVIEQYPETGQRVFKLVYDEFVAFLSKFLTRSDSTQRVMSVAQQVERKETMVIQYIIELRKMLNDMPVRDEIREFVFKVWAEVLAVAALKHGGQDEQTVMLKRTASELVWAASGKPNRADRARLIQELPKLLQNLREGMDLLGLVGDSQEEHIKTISKSLSNSFMSKSATITPAQTETLFARLSNLENVVSEEGDSAEVPLDPANIELLMGSDTSSIEVLPNSGATAAEAMHQWVRELQEGTWFLLNHNNRTEQVQFVWRSTRKQLLLFATSEGRRFLIQAGRLAAYLEVGLIRPTEEEPLVTRATRDALAKLDANPERLLT